MANEILAELDEQLDWIAKEIARRAEVQKEIDVELANAKARLAEFQ